MTSVETSEEGADQPTYRARVRVAHDHSIGPVEERQAERHRDFEKNLKRNGYRVSLASITLAALLRRLVYSRRPDRSSARIVCRHKHASYRRAVSILSFAAHVAHAIERLRVRVLSRFPPRSALELPVSHHLKIHSADQLGPVRLGGFHVGRRLL